MVRTFSEVLQDLQQQVGHAAGVDADADLEDEHVRWWLYRAALCEEARRPLVLESLDFEQDPALASTTVVTAVELVPADQRGDWVARLPAGRDRTYAERRVRELAILERLSGPDQSIYALVALQAWSPWLQLRLAARVNDRGLLDALAGDGATRRVRAIARERLRQLR